MNWTGFVEMILNLSKDLSEYFALGYSHSTGDRPATREGCNAVGMRLMVSMSSMSVCSCLVLYLLEVQ